VFSIGGRLWEVVACEVVAHGGSTVYTLDSSRVNSVKATKRVNLFPRATFLP